MFILLSFFFEWVNLLMSSRQSLAWMPVNHADDIMIKLLLLRWFQPFYHLENPSWQTWDGILCHLTSILGGKDAPFLLVLLSDWIRGIHALGEDPLINIAFKILGFLERDFERMASGTVILCTAQDEWIKRVEEIVCMEFDLSYGSMDTSWATL